MITFEALGLRWQANVLYTPPVPASWTEPPELSEVEILDLYNGRGVECGWVLESDEVREQIEAALRAQLDGDHRRALQPSLFDEP